MRLTVCALGDIVVGGAQRVDILLPRQATVDDLCDALTNQLVLTSGVERVNEVLLHDATFDEFILLRTLRPITASHIKVFVHPEVGAADAQKLTESYRKRNGSGAPSPPAPPAALVPTVEPSSGNTNTSAVAQPLGAAANNAGSTERHIGESALLPIGAPAEPDAHGTVAPLGGAVSEESDDASRRPGAPYVPGPRAVSASIKHDGRRVSRDGRRLSGLNGDMYPERPATAASATPDRHRSGAEGEAQEQQHHSPSTRSYGYGYGYNEGGGDPDEAYAVQRAATPLGDDRSGGAPRTPARPLGEAPLVKEAGAGVAPPGLNTGDASGAPAAVAGQGQHGQQGAQDPQQVAAFVSMLCTVAFDQIEAAGRAPGHRPAVQRAVDIAAASYFAGEATEAQALRFVNRAVKDCLNGRPGSAAQTPTKTTNGSSAVNNSGVLGSAQKVPSMSKQHREYQQQLEALEAEQAEHEERSRPTSAHRVTTDPSTAVSQARQDPRPATANARPSGQGVLPPAGVHRGGSAGGLGPHAAPSPGRVNSERRSIDEQSMLAYQADGAAGAASSTRVAPSAGQRLPRGHANPMSDAGARLAQQTPPGAEPVDPVLLKRFGAAGGDAYTYGSQGRNGSGAGAGVGGFSRPGTASSEVPGAAVAVTAATRFTVVNKWSAQFGHTDGGQRSGVLQVLERGARYYCWARWLGAHGNELDASLKDCGTSLPGAIAAFEAIFEAKTGARFDRMRFAPRRGRFTLLPAGSDFPPDTNVGATLSTVVEGNVQAAAVTRPLSAKDAFLRGQRSADRWVTASQDLDQQQSMQESELKGKHEAIMGGSPPRSFGKQFSAPRAAPPGPMSDGGSATATPSRQMSGRPASAALPATTSPDSGVRPGGPYSGSGGPMGKQTQQGSAARGRDPRSDRPLSAADRMSMRPTSGSTVSSAGQRGSAAAPAPTSMLPPLARPAPTSSSSTPTYPPIVDPDNANERTPTNGSGRSSTTTKTGRDFVENAPPAAAPAMAAYNASPAVGLNAPGRLGGTAEAAERFPGGVRGTGATGDQPPVTLLCVYAGVGAQRAKAVRVDRFNPDYPHMIRTLQQKFKCRRIGVGFLNPDGDVVEVASSAELRDALAVRLPRATAHGDSVSMRCWSVDAEGNPTADLSEQYLGAGQGASAHGPGMGRSPSRRSVASAGRSSAFSHASRLYSGAVYHTDDELREIFDELDVDGNGFLNPQEFREYFYENFLQDDLGVSDAESKFQTSMECTRAWQDGRLSFDEFCVMMLKRVQW